MRNAKVRWRIGIDVGGTNTDAVILDDDDRLLTSTKIPTTADITSGIRAALDDVLSAIDHAAGEVTSVVLGTTAATNAVVERRGLDRIAVIRIGSPVSDAVPPLTTWPEDLRRATLAGIATIAGGHLVDGHRIAPLDRDRLKRFLGELAGRVDAVALSGVFSPMFPDDEITAADVVRDLLGDEVRISMGHDIGALGMLERENATALNAALGSVGRVIVDGLRHAMRAHAMTIEPFIAQNDGTIMDADTATRLPILTIGSGPANSLRGAAFLSGVDDAIVVDVGGTTADFGVLTEGFGRESSTGSAIGGVHTNFPMPDIISLPYGGGTIIRRDRVGPDSVGHQLRERGLSFGGDTPTLTDAAIGCGRMTIPGHHTLNDSPQFQHALDEFDEAVGDAVAALTVHRRALPVIAVGGGNTLIAERIVGAGDVVRVPHAGVANAAGAASALIGASVETVAPMSRRADLLENAKAMAVAKAIAAGADPRHTHPVTITETALGYTSEPTVRLKVKAAGPTLL